jgi:hypothetical protein
MTSIRDLGRTDDLATVVDGDGITVLATEGAEVDEPPRSF